MQTILNDIATYGPAVLQYGTMVVGAAAAAAAALPKAAAGSNPIWIAVRAVIDFLGANFGNASNAK